MNKDFKARILTDTCITYFSICFFLLLGIILFIINFKIGEVVQCIAPLMECEGFFLLTYFDCMFFNGSFITAKKIFDNDSRIISNNVHKIASCFIIMGCIFWFISVILIHYGL